MDFSIAFPGGRLLEYFDDEHMYLVNGVIVPSVTQYLDIVYGKKYVNVDSAVLKRAADRGTMVHKAIEVYCKTGEETPIDELKNFKFLQEKYGFEVIGNEMPVIIDLPGLTLAGRLDLVLKMGGKIGGADIKCVSTMDKERTGMQLNLYRIGFKQSYGVEWDFLRGIQLKGEIRRFTELPVNEDYLFQKLKEYKDESCNDDWKIDEGH